VRKEFITQSGVSLSPHDVPRWPAPLAVPLDPPLATAARGHVMPCYAWQDQDWPHIPTLVVHVHFVLTHAHPKPTSRSVTHPRITPSQAHLTLELFSNGSRKKKECLIDMSNLSFLLRQALTYTPTQRNRRPRRSIRNVPSWHTYPRPV
jgi:hypothetical protein